MTTHLVVSFNQSFVIMIHTYNFRFLKIRYSPIIHNTSKMSFPNASHVQYMNGRNIQTDYNNNNNNNNNDNNNNNNNKLINESAY